MTTQSPATPPTLVPKPHLLTGYPAALVIIVLSYALGLLASTHNSATFDEGIHLVGGYIHLTLGQPRVHTENGYLSQAIAALPLLLVHPNLPDPSSPAFQHAQPFLLGRNFLYYSSNDPAQLLLLGRAAIGFLAALTGLVVYTWSRKLFSPLAGILSLILFAFAPVTLSHGFLTTSDMPATCFFLLSLATFWLTLQKSTPLRMTLSILSLAALFLAKMSAPLIVPVLLLLLIAHYFANRSKTVARRMGRYAFLFLSHAIAVYILIWAAYGFTYSAFKNSPQNVAPAAAQTFWPANGWDWALANPTPFLNMVAFARDHHFLPEAYLYGYAFVSQTTAQNEKIPTFAAGIHGIGGWWWFHPYVFLITTPLSLFVLIAISIALSLNTFLKYPSPKLKLAAHILYPFSPLLIFIILYWFAAILSHRNAGPRHLLPAYPMLCILLGSLTIFPAPFRASLWKKAIAAIVLLFTVESCLSYPYYMAYFNPLIGGPSHAYRYIVDSALDWGQALPSLADYLKNNNPQKLPVYLAYFGNAEPNAYLDAIALPSFVPRPEQDIAALQPLQPGLYCISATILSAPFTPQSEHDYEALLHDAQIVQYLKSHPERTATLTDLDRQRIAQTPLLLREMEFLRLSAFLLHREPIAQAGYAINIYPVTAADLNQALHRPPHYDQ